MAANADGEVGGCSGIIPRGVSCYKYICYKIKWGYGDIIKK